MSSSEPRIWVLIKLSATAYTVKGSATGDFGGGSLEPLMRWLGSQWPGATLGAPNCPEPPGAR